MGVVGAVHSPAVVFADATAVNLANKVGLYLALPIYKADYFNQT
jgi:hypothetical protein